MPLDFGAVPLVVAPLLFALLVVEALLRSRVGPVDYRLGDPVTLNVNAMTSVNTHVPFDHYFIPGCRPAILHTKAENIGELMRGDRIMSSPYGNLRVGVNETCSMLCRRAGLDNRERQMMALLISKAYRIQLILDKLPVMENDVAGVPIGDSAGNLFNHLHFTVRYKEIESEGEDSVVRIVSFSAKPSSIRHDRESATCGSTTPQRMDDPTVAWSYSVAWVVTSNEEASNRWDRYAAQWWVNGSIRSLSFANAGLMALILTFLLVFISRHLHGDGLDTEEAEEEATRWMVLHGDVFRTPAHHGVLAALSGSGVQLFGMAAAVALLGSVGSFSPEHPGVLLTVSLVLFAAFGGFAGFATARLLKMWGTSSWGHVFGTGLIVPGLAYGTFSFINLLLWKAGSTAAVQLSTRTVLCATWITVSLPMVLMGASTGFKRPTIEAPVKTNSIPREVPSAGLLMKPAITILFAGLLPFAVVYIQLIAMLDTIWMLHWFTSFGYLLLSGMILTVTSGSVAIVLCYYQLCAEDHRWMWRSFFTTGSSGAWIFVYAVFYFFERLPQGFTSTVSVVMYFGYMGLISVLFSIMTGSIGFLACLWFTRRIFCRIHIDTDYSAANV